MKIEIELETYNRSWEETQRYISVFRKALENSNIPCKILRLEIKNDG